MADSTPVDHRWTALAAPARAVPLAVLLGGVLLYATNTLLVTTVLPSIVGEVGGVAVVTWPTIAFVSASILASAATGLVTARLGARHAYAAGLVVFAVGALACGLAPSMALVIAGRFVQGLGGGLISALAYILVRNVFPEALWVRVLALISGTWGVAVLLGPMIGGVFAGLGFWRGAFLSVAAVAVLLVPLAYAALPRTPARGSDGAGLPGLRLALVIVGIVAIAVAGITAAALWKAALIALALAVFAAFLRLDRVAGQPILPSDAFTITSRVGLGLWMVLLLAAANTPFPIIGPLLLQQLHGLDPLTAGYLAAGGAMSWTVVAAIVASLPAAWLGFFLVAGPLAMVLGLLGIGLVLPTGPAFGLLVPIFLVGGGIGACWTFLSQQVMAGARTGEGDTAAASIAAVQMTGLALGGALAGLVANLAGFAVGLDDDAARRASFWVPAAFVAPALLAGAFGIGMRRLEGWR
ncbi:MFS transporter [Desertibaculum subflavum]|uniref:MFS transporter n=1 Tax=Desertibaculum subflavum TaxID=2268458 RepID=UPI0013C408F5